MEEPDPIITHGAFKGRPLSTVPLNYLLWVIKLMKVIPDEWTQHIEQRQKEEKYGADTDNTDAE
jgi:hypothetical protein